MRFSKYLCLYVVFLFSLVFLNSGCGGSRTVMPKPAPSPTPAAPAPAPTPSPTPSPTPAPTSPQWRATVSSSTNPNLGSVSVSTAGDVTIQLTGAPASKAYNVSFCQFPAATFAMQSKNACFNVTAVSTNATGAANATVHFPLKGAWSGRFEFDTGTTMASDSLSTESAALTGSYNAMLVPMSTANGGIMADPLNPQDPLASGTVTVSSAKFTVTVSGAVANTVYSVTECSTFGSSECQNNWTLTTDPRGDGTTSAAVATASGGSVFRLLQATKSSGGFVSGFTVP